MSTVQMLVFTLFFILFQFELSSSNEKSCHVKFFDNIAEVSEPISPFDLPKYYSSAQWADIRPDSIQLVGQHLRVLSQVQTLHRPSLNGQKVLIQRQTSSLILTEAIMIDESRNLIHDLTDSTYYTINTDRIRYLTVPGVRNYSVDFVLEISHPGELNLRYLRNNIRWRVRYDLILSDKDADSYLQASAEIRNDGNSLLNVESGELVSGDINIRPGSSHLYDSYAIDTSYMYSTQAIRPDYAAASPMVSQAQEFQGIYIFPLNQSFIIEARSILLFPMFRPQILVERFGIIEKSFSRTNNRGNARRAYRLSVPGYYLPRGQVSIRESDRLVGETNWSERSANETNEFTLGFDPDLLYTETIELNSRRQAHEENGYRIVLSTYTIELSVNNKKTRSLNVEYRLQFPSQEHLVIKENTSDNRFSIDGPTIVGILRVDAHGMSRLQFTVETQ